MLYDPNWNKPPKPNVFALTTLITWLETHPPSERYNYSNPGFCLLAQYFTEMTGDNVVVTANTVHLGTEVCTKVYNLPKGWDDIACGMSPYISSCTFGAALKRAKRHWLRAAAGSIWSRIPQYLGLA